MNTFTGWSTGYPTIRHPVFGREIVATSQPLAAAAGVQMLHEGGNAVDAAIATAIALTIVEPCSNGIGSDAFAIVWDGQQVHGLNASGRSPSAWNPERFASHTAMPTFGWEAVTIPGAVSAWMELSGRFGRLPFDRLFAPAIAYARDGFMVTPMISRRWAYAHERLKQHPGFSTVFSADGRTPSEGELWRLPAHARGLEAIADSGGHAFYSGEIARAIVAWSDAHGGSMTLDDLAAHQADWVETISTEYRGHHLHEIPPNGQGITALIALGVVRVLEQRGIDLAQADPDSPEVQHLLIEAIKIGFADAYHHVSDPASAEFDPHLLLSHSYLEQRADLYDPRRAQTFLSGAPAHSGTVYLTTADRDGMMVSMIQSNYMGFGSGVVEPTYGIALQNRGNGFVLTPGHPNQVGPRKRPFHTIIPAMLTRDSQAQMSFGVMGGHMQPQGHLQTLIRMLAFGQHPQAACDAPRFRWNEGVQINLENSFPAETRAGLDKLGHQIADRNDSSVDFGYGQFIWALDNGYVGATDPRSGGLALAL